MELDARECVASVGGSSGVVGEQEVVVVAASVSESESAPCDAPVLRRGTWSGGGCWSVTASSTVVQEGVYACTDVKSGDPCGGFAGMCISVAELQDASMTDFYERRRRCGSSERWQLQTLLAAGAFRRGCDFKSWSDAVGEFEEGEITRFVYEVRTVKALGLRRWFGFVDQVSVVNAGKLPSDVFGHFSLRECYRNMA